MKDCTMHYDAIIKVTRAISECRDPEEVALLTVRSVKNAYKAKGCSVFLINRETQELELAASFGLSDEYLRKGPIHYLQSIQEAKDNAPVAIFDVQDDPRIQYPEAAGNEGISSILGVPIVAHGKTIGVMRIYTAEPWEFTVADISLAQAIAQICGMAMDMCRLHKGYKTSIEILKNMRGKDTFATRKWTPHEGVPKSVTPSICNY